jgi:predicted ATP-grasp superfamily ATP-dependent carboligase
MGTNDVSANGVGAIILGGNFVGLGIARSLGPRGIPICVVDSDKSKSIAQFSRYTKKFIESREPVHELLLREAQQHGLKGWVVFPVSDEYVEAIATHHSSLSPVFRLITPPLAVIEYALDKRLTYDRAAALGIAAPWTLVCGSEEELAGKAIPYPVILKPAINHHFFPQTNVKALSVSGPDDLRKRFAQMSKYIPAGEILIQEKIPGGGENQFSFCAICSNGKASAALVAQRKRQYPIEFGNASSFVETTTQPIVEAHGRLFLESVGFDGMGEVEFKYDPRDDKYKILDFNPRPWGWHRLGKAAGIDFPYLLWRQKVHGDAAAVSTARHAAWIREMTDVMAIAKSRQRGAELRRLVKALVSRRIALATFSFVDPVPFFAEFALWATQGVSRQKKAQEFLADS